MCLMPRDLKTREAQILLKARRLIEQGWIQGDFKNKDGVCSVHAIREAAGMRNHGYYLNLVGYLINKINRNRFGRDGKLIKIVEESIGCPDLMSWNDSICTKQEVLTAFDRAIAKCEGATFVQI